MDPDHSAEKLRGFEELLRAPKKRRECLGHLEVVRTSYGKTSKRAASFVGLFGLLAFVLWKMPGLLGVIPKSPLLAELLSIAPIFCILVAMIQLLRGLSAAYFRVDIDSQIRCLQLVEYIDEKTR